MFDAVVQTSIVMVRPSSTPPRPVCPLMAALERCNGADGSGREGGAGVAPGVDVRWESLRSAIELARTLGEIKVVGAPIAEPFGKLEAVVVPRTLSGLHKLDAPFVSKHTATIH